MLKMGVYCHFNVSLCAFCQMSHKSKEIPFLFLQKEHYNLSPPRLRGFRPDSFTKYPLLFKKWQCAKTCVFFWLYLCPYKLFSPLWFHLSTKRFSAGMRLSLFP